MLQTESGLRSSGHQYRKKGARKGMAASPDSTSKTRSQTNFTQSKSSVTIQSRPSKMLSRKKLSTMKKDSLNRDNSSIEYAGGDGSKMVLVGGPSSSQALLQQQ